TFAVLRTLYGPSVLTCASPADVKSAIMTMERQAFCLICKLPEDFRRNRADSSTPGPAAFAPTRFQNAPESVITGGCACVPLPSRHQRKYQFRLANSTP